MLANRIQVFKDGNFWLALVGLDPVKGVMAHHERPRDALLRLATRLEHDPWLFDPDFVRDASRGHQNVAVLSRHPTAGFWTAAFGPTSEGIGLSARGGTPGAAIHGLAHRIQQHGWRFQPNWRPE